MKKSDITEEVIRLSKEIAGYWRMEIYEGCWIIAFDELIRFHPVHMRLDGIGLKFLNGACDRNWFPIPSISDCLAKLKEMGYMLKIKSYAKEWLVELYEMDENEQVIYLDIGRDSLHLALLSALLDVVQDEK